MKTELTAIKGFAGVEHSPMLTSFGAVGEASVAVGDVSVGLVATIYIM
jgi:hypothetical protein